MATDYTLLSPSLIVKF